MACLLGIAQDLPSTWLVQEAWLCSRSAALCQAKNKTFLLGKNGVNPQKTPFSSKNREL